MSFYEIIATGAFLLLINATIYSVKRLQIAAYKCWVSLLFFNVKFLAGIALWVIYTFYYTSTEQSDIYKYYNDAKVLYQSFEEHPRQVAAIIIGAERSNDVTDTLFAKMKWWNTIYKDAPFNESRLVIRINAFLMFLTRGTYLAHVLFFCFIAYIGWLLLYNTLLKFAPAFNAILALPLLFLPNVLLWSSGILKEPLMMLGLGLALSGLFSGIFCIKNIFRLSVGIMLLLVTKFYMLSAFSAAGIVFFLIQEEDNPRKSLVKFVGVNGILLLLVLLTPVLPQIPDVMHKLQIRQGKAIAEAMYFNAGSFIDIPLLGVSLAGNLYALGYGFFNALLQPSPWNANNPMSILCSIENFVFLSYMALLLGFATWCKSEQTRVSFTLLTLSFVALVVIGVCNPVVGNLVRYKSSLLPLLGLALVIQVSPKVVALNFSFLLRNKA